MQQPSIGLTDADRLKVITFLNSILRQYYSTQPEYLLRRAKQYESMCFKRAQNKQQYYHLVKDGVYKIAKTYEKTSAHRAAAAAAAAAHNPQQQAAVSSQNPPIPGTPVTPNAAPPVSAPGIPTAATAVRDFLLSLGLTPFPGSIPPANLPPSAPAPTSTSLPNQSSALPIDLAGLPSGEHAAPSTPPYQHLPATSANHVLGVSRPSSTTSLHNSINIPPSQQLKTSAAHHPTPPNPAAVPTEPPPQNAPKTPRSKNSTERSKIQRAGKRNSSKAGLQTPTPPKPPTHRQIAPKAETLNKENASVAPTSAHNPTASLAHHQGQIGALYSQQVHPTHPTPHVNILPSSCAQADVPRQENTQNPPPQDRVYIADDIHVPIAQVYIAAASIGYRLNAGIIKRLSRDQVVNIFVRARQVAVAKATNATLNNVAQPNLPSRQDPLGIVVPSSTMPSSVPVSQPGLLASDASAQQATASSEEPLVLPTSVHGSQNTTIPPATTVPGLETGNVAILQNQLLSKHAQPHSIPIRKTSSHPIPNQALVNGPNRGQDVSAPTSPSHKAAFPVQMEQISDAIRSSENQILSQGIRRTSRHTLGAVSNAIPTAGCSQRTGQGNSFVNLTHTQNGTSSTPPEPCEPSALQLLVIRLQRFQQKYRVYLKLVQENLAAMMSKRVEESETQRKFRYMHYAIKLLTCPASNAHKLSMDIIDKVESFLREYLVIYQGIALKNRASANSTTAVRGSTTGVGVGSDYASNIVGQPSVGPSPSSLPQTSGPGIRDSVLAGQDATIVPDMSHLNNPIASAPVSKAPPQNNLDVDSQAKAQNESVAAAGIHKVQAKRRTLNNPFLVEDLAPPKSGSNLRTSPPVGRKSPPVSGAQKRTPQDVHSEIAKRVSRVNHYVRMAVHWTDCFEKQLEHEPLLRVREERIAEICYVVETEKRKRAESESGKEKKQEPSLMDIVRKECEDARKKYGKLMIEIGEEWKKPVVKCLLAFKSVRLPKLVVNVPGSYKRERRVTFGFERPPVGWIGIVGDVRKKFHSIREGKDSVGELLEAWVRAAEEVLYEE